MTTGTILIVFKAMICSGQNEVTIIDNPAVAIIATTAGLNVFKTPCKVSN